MKDRKRRLFATFAAAALLLGFSAACEKKSDADSSGSGASGEPIVVGSTLSLSGAFAATGAIHKIAGEQFVERLNANGGLLGRPVEWVVRDDESKAALDRLGPEATEIVNEFHSRAQAANLPYTAFETQAAASWTAWEILVAGVQGAGGLDHKKICDSLHANGAKTTFAGTLEFDPAKNNFWPSNELLKQIQDKDRVTVWPPDRAVAQLRAPASS